MKALVFASVFTLLSFNIANAEQCFPSGSITVGLPGSTGQTTHAVVSPMGAITIDYPNGSLQGNIDSLGHFTASNDHTTVSGNVNTSCSNSASISPTPSVCSAPHAVDCTSEADYQYKVTATNMYGITPGSTSLTECRKQIDDYQTATANWQKCMKDSYGYDTQTNTWDATLTKIENKPVKTDSTTKVGTASPTSNKYSCPVGSEGIISTDGSFRCRTYSQGCQLKYGKDSWGDGSYCHICSGGNVVNPTNTDCVPANIVASSTLATPKTILASSTPKKQKISEKVVAKEHTPAMATSTPVQNIPQAIPSQASVPKPQKATLLQRVSKLFSLFHF